MNKLDPQSREQLAWRRLFEARAPRYTSYPPANHFDEAVGAADAERWLQDPDPAPASIYVHVPFCRRLCWFCACRTQGVTSARPVAHYLDILTQEIALVKERMGGRRAASAIHWGGGTPTILEPDQIARLNAALRETFDMGPDASFSVEIDPNEIDAARVDALAAAGLTRASLGVQDFDPAIQKAIGRDQSFEITAKAVEMMRAVGVESLNADLVYGLPGQTEDTLRRTIGQLLWLRPDRIALYGYAHVPWMSRRQAMIDASALPRAEARFDLFETARRIFLEAGYVAIGIDHFALPEDSLAKAARDGGLRRNFQGYTEDGATTLIGLGASSVSRFPQGYAQNAASTAAYLKAIEEGRLATARGYALSEEDRWRGAAIERLMCDMALDLADPRLPACPDPEGARRALAEIGEGFGDTVAIEGSRLEITPEGRPLVRLMAQALDQFEVRQQAHSAAV